METRIFLDVRVPASRNLLFDVPHKSEPMKVSRIIKELPDFAKIMDGESKENTMLFYWKLNKQTGIYEFISEEDEDEVVELMGVNLCKEVYEEEVDPDAPINRPLNNEELKRHQENLDDIREGLKYLNKNTAGNKS